MRQHMSAPGTGAVSGCPRPRFMASPRRVPYVATLGGSIGMREFTTAATGFPTLLLTAALVVVVAFWLLALVGAADRDAFDGDLPLTAIGLGGVPAAVAVSVLVLTSWLTGVTGTLALHRLTAPGLSRTLLSLAVLALALLAGHQSARLLVRLRRRVRPHPQEPARPDLVGRTCTIRTGRVDDGFGRAEVAVRGAAPAVVRVRQLGGEPPLGRGSRALLYAYDDSGGFFWVTPQPLAAA